MKPTTIDGREVLWHGMVDDHRYPGEVAVVPGDFGDVTVYGKYGSRWIPNSGNRAAVRMLLDEVERLKALEATLPKTVDGVTIHHGMRVWVHSIYKDRSDWYAVRAIFQPCDGDRAWLLRGGQHDFFSDECYSSPEAAKESP